MKKTMIVMVTALLGVVLTTQAREMGEMQAGAGESRIVRATDLKDMSVVNLEGEEIGTFEDMVLNATLDQVDYAIVASGGILGIGQDRYAVPLQAFRMDIGAENLVLDATEEGLRDSPKIRDGWPSQTGEEVSEVRQYWQQASARVRDAFTADTADRGRRERQQAQADQVWGRKASDLIDSNVKNQANEDIATLQDLAIVMQHGHVAYGLLSGIEALEDDMVAVLPWQTLNIQPQEESVQLVADQARLSEVAFHNDALPDLANREQGERIHNAFEQEPYWTVYGYEDEDMKEREMD